MGSLKIGTIETLCLKIHKKYHTALRQDCQCGKHQNHPEIGLFNMPYFTIKRKDGKLWQVYTSAEKRGHIRSTITRMESKRLYLGAVLKLKLKRKTHPDYN